MSWQDIVNGSFELFSGLFLWMNVYQIRQDKKVTGIRVLPVVVFTTWGFWNLYYYPHLNQWFSLFGGLSIVTANIVWLLHVWRYNNNDN